MPTTEKKKYTDQDYMLLEEGAPFQLINYDLIMSPSANFQHQIISGKLYRIISNHLEITNDEGIVLYSPMDVAFDEGNVFQPDLFYISAERKTDIIRNRIEGTPDLVIEILSPSNAYYDLRQKKDIYERYGVREYLIFDPMSQNAEVHVLENSVFVLKQKAAKTEVLNSVILPGLNFDLSKLF